MIETGEKAPDMDITLADGSRCRLGDFWRESPLVLILLRHLG